MGSAGPVAKGSGGNAMDQREEALAGMAGTRLDLLVIGGGITGAGVAREAALRGLRVGLVERNDFAAGTSSRSTKLVHGGLRYLKSGDFRLVREAVLERQRLIQMAPHLVRSAAFLFPVYRGDPDPLWKLRIGLTLYDWFAGRHRVPRHQVHAPAGVLAQEPLLQPAGLTGGAIYTDAVTDDARLTLAVLASARQAGALVANYTEVTGFTHGQPPRRQVTAVCLRDHLGDASLTVGCRTVLNATGPWLDALRRLEDPGAVPVLRPTKGVHVAVPGHRLPLRQAVVLRSTDRRLMFAIPSGDYTYIGTTDTDYDGDLGEPPVDAADVDYILAAVNRSFPDCRLTVPDVVSVWAGLRPLLDPGDGRRPAEVSRDYRLFRSPGGLVSVGGGKLTTFRAMAVQIVDELLPESRGRVPAVAAVAPLPGAARPTPAEVAAAAASAGVPQELAVELAGRHGSDFIQVLAELRPGDLDAPRRTVCLRLQTRYAVRHELARRLADVLVRRTPEFLFSADNGRDLAAAVAADMAELLGWGPERTQAELAAYLDQVGQMQAWRRPDSGSPP